MSRPLSPQPLSRSSCNMASCWWGTFRLIYCHKFCCSQAVAASLPPFASTLHSCFYFLVVVVKMRTYLSFPLQFVLILICCPSYTLTHTRASIASAREPFACHSISNSLNQSVRHTVSLSVRLSVSLALSVSHCVNTLITGGKRCATHTQLYTHTHTHAHMLLGVTFIVGNFLRCSLPLPLAFSPFDLWLLCQHRQFLCSTHSITPATPTPPARVWACVAFVIHKFKIQFTCVINLIASAKSLDLLPQFKGGLYHIERVHGMD